MNGTNGKKSDFPDVALVPYPVIVAATKGDPDAMKGRPEFLESCGRLFSTKDRKPSARDLPCGRSHKNVQHGICCFSGC